MKKDTKNKVCPECRGSGRIIENVGGGIMFTECPCQKKNKVNLHKKIIKSGDFK